MCPVDMNTVSADENCFHLDKVERKHRETADYAKYKSESYKTASVELQKSESSFCSFALRLLVAAKL